LANCSKSADSWRPTSPAGPLYARPQSLFTIASASASGRGDLCLSSKGKAEAASAAITAADISAAANSAAIDSSAPASSSDKRPGRQAGFGGPVPVVRSPGEGWFNDPMEGFSRQSPWAAAVAIDNPSGDSGEALPTAP
jgi:hypothetical protein